MRLRSKRRIGFRPALLVFGCVVAFGARPAAAQFEKDLWTLWTEHIAQTGASDRVIGQCSAFEQAHRPRSVANVARGLAAWHHLARGDQDAALLIYRKMESDLTDPLAAAGDAMARRWRTRIDIKTVRGALQEYYKDKLAYPPSLEELAGYSPAGKFPATDRFGKPWLYLRMPMRRASRITDQRYSISSSTMRRTSNLDRELKHAYAHDFRPAFVKNLPSVGGPPFARFVNDAGTEKQTYDLLSGGTDPRHANVRLVYTGKAIFVLSNGDHWYLVRRP